jgi:hypothetical protein
MMGGWMIVSLGILVLLAVGLAIVALLLRSSPRWGPGQLDGTDDTG